MGETGVHVTTVEVGQIKALIWLKFGGEDRFYTTTLMCECTDSAGERRSSYEFAAGDFVSIREATFLAQQKIAELKRLDDADANDEWAA